MSPRSSGLSLSSLMTAEQSVVLAAAAKSARSAA